MVASKIQRSTRRKDRARFGRRPAHMEPPYHTSPTWHVRPPRIFLQAWIRMCATHHSTGSQMLSNPSRWILIPRIWDLIILTASRINGLEKRSKKNKEVVKKTCDAWSCPSQHDLIFRFVAVFVSACSSAFLLVLFTSCPFFLFPSYFMCFIYVGGKDQCHIEATKVQINSTCNGQTVKSFSTYISHAFLMKACFFLG